MKKEDIQLLAAIKTIENSQNKTFDMVNGLLTENLELRENNNQTRQHINRIQKEITDLKNSRSWKLTQPLRRLKSYIRVKV